MTATHEETLRGLVRLLVSKRPDLEALQRNRHFAELVRWLPETPPQRLAYRLRDVVRHYLAYRLAMKQGESTEQPGVKLDAARRRLGLDQNQRFPEFLRALAQVYETEGDLTSTLALFEAEEKSEISDQRRGRRHDRRSKQQATLCK